jgi:hypothetical protein
MDDFTKSLLETQEQRLKQNVMKHTGIDLDSLEWAFLVVSDLSAVMGSEFVSATKDFSFFIFACPGISSVQLSLKREEIVLHHSPYLSVRRMRKLKAFASTYGFKIVELHD